MVGGLVLGLASPAQVAPAGPWRQQTGAESFEAVMDRGNTALAAGDTDTAVAAFRRALQLQPRQPQTLMQLGVALLRSGQQQQAVEALERAVAIDPGLTSASLTLGSLFSRRDAAVGELLRAAEAYERASDQRPLDPQICLALVRVYRRLNLLEEARQLLARFAENGSMTMQLDLAYGRLLSQLGRFQEARPALERAIEAGAGPLAYFELGIVARNQSELQLAGEAFGAAIAQRPGFAMAHLRRAKVYIALEDFAAAKADFQSAIAIDPERAEPHELLGQSILESGDPAGSIGHLERALELEPERASAAYHLALALRDVGRREESRAMMQRFAGLKQQGDQATLRAQRQREIAAMLSQGLYYLRRGEPEIAIDRFEDALELSPEGDMVHVNLGLERSALNDHLGASEAFETALEIEPERPETYAALSREYRALGREEEAQQMETRYRELQPEQP